MKEFLDKTFAYIKANLLISIAIGLVVVFLLFGRQVKRLLFGTRRVRHRRPYMAAVSRRSARARRRRTLPRSVGMLPRTRRTNKAAYNKNGSRKKPWQIAGSPAARRHMAEIRKRR